MTLQRKTVTGALAFLAGFVAIVLLGKGLNGYLINGMHAYVPNGIFLQGIVLGALNGMLAVGRANISAMVVSAKIFSILAVASSNFL